MERDNYLAASLIAHRPERKVIEKNRRNQMKFLYLQLFSLLPQNKGCGQMSDRVNEVIQYIESLKFNIEKLKDKKEKLFSINKLHEYPTSEIHEASTSESLHHIEIHEMSPDVDVVIIFGMKTYSRFCDIVRVLDQNSTALGYACFSTSGPSTFHVHNKKIEAAEMHRRLNELIGGPSEKEIVAPPCNEEESNLDLWDFEISSDVWFRNS